MRVTLLGFWLIPFGISVYVAISEALIPHLPLQNSALLAHDCSVDRFHWCVCRAAL